VQTVELLLDALTDAAVRAEWQLLADAGLPSQALHQGLTNAPHITLGVARSIPDEVESRLPSAMAALPLAVELGAVVVFGSRRLALARLVLADRLLLDLHETTAAVMAPCTGVPHYLQAGHWTPHVTLARGLGTAQVGPALDALGQVTSLSGTIEQARRWDSEQRKVWLLGDGHGAPSLHVSAPEG
jgi:2'-5' RNA ligase